MLPRTGATAVSPAAPSSENDEALASQTERGKGAEPAGPVGALIVNRFWRQKILPVSRRRKYVARPVNVVYLVLNDLIAQGLRFLFSELDPGPIVSKAFATGFVHDW